MDESADGHLDYPNTFSNLTYCPGALARKRSLVDGTLKRSAFVGPILVRYLLPQLAVRDVSGEWWGKRSTCFAVATKSKIPDHLFIEIYLFYCIYA